MTADQWEKLAVSRLKLAGNSRFIAAIGDGIAQGLRNQERILELLTARAKEPSPSTPEPYRNPWGGGDFGERLEDAMPSPPEQSAARMADGVREAWTRDGERNDVTHCSRCGCEIDMQDCACPVGSWTPTEISAQSAE